MIKSKTNLIVNIHIFTYKKKCWQVKSIEKNKIFFLILISSERPSQALSNELIKLSFGKKLWLKGHRNRRNYQDVILPQVHLCMGWLRLRLIQIVEIVVDCNSRLQIVDYGVATISRLLKNIGLIAEYRSLL